jgi:hypothetical protein
MLRTSIALAVQPNMPATYASHILVTLLVALFPLALYCLVLAAINRRSVPLVVRGVWDFVGVLFAASGMLLWAGPAMLVTLYERSVTEAPRSFDAIWREWWLIWAGYYGLLLAGATLLLWGRRHATAIYHVNTEAVPQVFALALQRLGYDFAQNLHHQFLIAPAKSLAPSAAETGVTALPAFAEKAAPALEAEGLLPVYSAAVEIDAFPAMCHATLHWYEADPHVRREIEAELRKSLVAARPGENPATTWQLGVSVLLFGAMFLGVLFYVLLAVFPRRW